MTLYETMSKPRFVTSTPSLKSSALTRGLVRAISAYQYLRAGRQSPCRFYPSCSQYAIEALQTHGALRGLRLSTWRVARCNPFGAHGPDPVPAPRKANP